MSEKFLNSRIIHKHDVESNWNKATNFIPKQGELIIYDIDDTHDYERIKIGDGTTNVNDLPFYAGSWDDLKNRPFGVTKSIEELLPENTYVTTSDVQKVCNFGTTIVAGDTYVVTHNGTEYKIVASSDFLGDKIPYLLWDISNGYKYPFYIRAGDGVNVFGAGTHTIKIEHVAEDIQQIDSKFIPADKFVVTFFANRDPVECDKTYDEIVEAHEAGKDISGQWINGFTWKTSTYDYHSSTNKITFYFELATSTNMRVEAWSIDSSNTITVEYFHSIEIDSGLTISGRAADAKATGDAISDLSTLVGNSSVSEQINNAFKSNQSNYTQNDSTAADYIKNRPFYSEMGEVTYVDHTLDFAEFKEGLYLSSSASSLIIEAGETYIVVFDGTSYSCTGYIPGDGMPVCLGNASIMGAPGGNNEPFLVSVESGSTQIGTNLTGASHTVKITGHGEVVKTLDPKFIPGGLTYIVNGAWDVNDNMTGDKTFAEIQAAHNDGKLVLFIIEGRSLYYLQRCDNSNASFASVQIPSIDQINCTSENVWSYVTTDLAIPSELEAKMDKENPTGTGSFSLNRKASTTIGNWSFTEGYNTTASGNNSHAEGSSTTASGLSSHAEGFSTTASGSYSHVQGKYNIEDSSNTYADIIGNGTDRTARSNAATVDWNGNAWYAGDVYVGSTSGTHKDAGSKKLATEEYVSTELENYTPDPSLGITNAAVGQIARITAVDSDGKPTAWEPVDMASGGVTASVEPAEDDIPKVYWTGALPTSKTEGDIQGTIRYKSKTADFQYPATLRVQGSSSANYAKKNFTLKVYSDSTYVDKVKLAFRDWGKLNKFVLKAHWIDHSHVRNVGTAKIWGKIVEARSDYASLPEELRNAPNNGATDGFSIKFFANGVYQGLYEWIVPKDKLFGQDPNIVTHSILNSELNDQPTCAFATTSPTISGNWSEELQDTMSTAISTSFANLIKFVAGSTDEEFMANAENYFDVQSVIDFDIFARVFCIVDNLCRNQIFFTYDGVKWYEGVWDVDAILGLPPTVRNFFAYDTEFQTGYIAYKDYGVTNLLYQRVENLFLERFKARYAELRSGVLSVDSIIDVYERLTDTITTYDGLLEEDYASTTGGGDFTGIPYTSENNIQQIRNFVAQRTAYMDEVIGNMAGESGGGEVKPDVPENVPCTGIELSASSLTFDGEGSQTLTATATPDGCTDEVVWSTNAPAVATVSGGVVTAVGNGYAAIIATCGEQSATCAVSVSGMEAVNILDGVSWHYGSINGITGAPISGTVNIISDAVDVSEYAGGVAYCETDSGGVEGQKIVFFDANNSFISCSYTSDKSWYCLIPDNAATAKLGMLATGTKFGLSVASKESSLLDLSNEQIGKYYDSADGTQKTDVGYNSQKVALPGNGTVLAYKIKSGALYATNDAWLRTIAYNTADFRTIDVVSAAAAGMNYLAADNGVVFAQILENMASGESTVGTIN